MFFCHHLILSSHHEKRVKNQSHHHPMIIFFIVSVGARGDGYRKTLMEQTAMRWAYNQLRSKLIIIVVITIIYIIILNKDSLNLNGCNTNKHAPHSCAPRKVQSLRFIILFQDTNMVINLPEHAIPAATQKGVSLGVCRCYKGDHV